MRLLLSNFSPFALSRSKGVPFLLQKEKGRCFDKLSTNGFWGLGD